LIDWTEDLELFHLIYAGCQHQIDTSVIQSPHDDLFANFLVGHDLVIYGV